MPPLKDFLARAHDAFFEEAVATPASRVPAVETFPHPDIPNVSLTTTDDVITGITVTNPGPMAGWHGSSMSAETPSVSLDSSGSDPFLPALTAKTDFDSTPVGQQVLQHLLPLDGLPLSDAQKMTAVLKAGARDGLTAEKIISTYQNFQAILKVEESTFTAAMQRAMDDQVAARQKAIEAEASKVKNLEAEITDSRERQSKLSAELITAQTNIQRKQAQFKAALDARATDITAAIQHYTSILQGGN